MLNESKESLLRKGSKESQYTPFYTMTRGHEQIYCLSSMLSARTATGYTWIGIGDTLSAGRLENFSINRYVFRGSSTLPSLPVCHVDAVSAAQTAISCNSLRSQFRVLCSRFLNSRKTLISRQYLTAYHPCHQDMRSLQ